GDFRACTLTMRFTPGSSPEASLRDALEMMCREASRAIADGASLLVLSDRQLGPDEVPIPSLLAVGAVQNHLIREGTRMRAGLIVETAEAREVAHLALLIGYGAGAVNPYLALDTVAHLAETKVINTTPEKAQAYYIKALKKGLLKTMSKMGISAVA